MLRQLSQIPDDADRAAFMADVLHGNYALPDVYYADAEPSASVLSAFRTRFEIRFIE